MKRKNCGRKLYFTKKLSPKETLEVPNNCITIVIGNDNDGTNKEALKPRSDESETREPLFENRGDKNQDGDHIVRGDDKKNFC